MDGWRAVAILGVVIHHGTSQSSRLLSLTEYGRYGVDLFFAISGFLICSRLLEEEKHGKISLKHFYIRRAFRILPPAFVNLGVVGLLGLTGWVVVTRIEWLSCLLFFRNYLPLAPPTGWYTAHYWSLAVEEHFYLLWPCLLVVFGSKRMRTVVVILVVMIAGWRMLDFRFQWVAQLWPSQAFNLARTDYRLDSLLWGCWFALLLQERRWQSLLTKVLSFPVWLVLIFTFFLVAGYGPRGQLIWQAIVLPMIVLGTVLRPTGYAGRLLEWPVLKWVGRCSYSIYLWQQLFFTNRYLSSAWIQRPPFNVAALLACVLISYYLVERPMILIGHKIAGGKAPRQARESNGGSPPPEQSLVDSNGAKRLPALP